MSSQEPGSLDQRTIALEQQQIAKGRSLLLATIGTSTALTGMLLSNVLTLPEIQRNINTFGTYISAIGASGAIIGGIGYLYHTLRIPNTSPHVYEPSSASPEHPPTQKERHP